MFIHLFYFTEDIKCANNITCTGKGVFCDGNSCECQKGYNKTDAFSCTGNIIFEIFFTGMSAHSRNTENLKGALLVVPRSKQAHCIRSTWDNYLYIMLNSPMYQTGCVQIYRFDRWQGYNILLGSISAIFHNSSFKQLHVKHSTFLGPLKYTTKFEVDRNNGCRKIQLNRDFFHSIDDISRQ